MNVPAPKTVLDISHKGATKMSLRKKITLLIWQAVVFVAIICIALYVYVKYVSSTARDTLGSGILLILLITILASLIGLCLVHFAAKTRTAYPRVARHLPVAFSLLTSCYLLFSLLRLYSLSAGRVISYFLVSLGVCLGLNIAAHCLIKRRSISS